MTIVTWSHKGQVSTFVSEVTYYHCSAPSLPISITCVTLQGMHELGCFCLYAVI